MRVPMRWAAAAVMAIAITVGAAALIPPRSQGGSQGARPLATSALAPLVPLAGPAWADPAAHIAQLTEHLKAYPDDARALAALGIAYLQQARITADPSSYGKAEMALERALEVDDGNYAALLGLGALALARHDFAGALGIGRRAAALNPADEDPWGIIGDALLELGRYRSAFRAFQRMVDLRPGPAAYARVAYARELTGDLDGAVRAMRMAMDAAGTPQDAAWAAAQLGDLAWNRGAVAAAARNYRHALAIVPDYPAAEAGMARVAWARSRLDVAIQRLSGVVRRYPLPEYVVALGDLARVAGRRSLARAQYRLARAEHRLFRANGVNIDLELALFEADHGAPRAALRSARAEWARRKSIHVADALAWALYRNGRLRAAERRIHAALRLGTPNALFLYHAGMISSALGERDQARRYLHRALSISPWFSILHAADAQRTLRTLGGAA